MDLVLKNLKSVFEVKETIYGKVDMQKSFYFMKELGLPSLFNFRWSKLGPYSYELANVVDRLSNQGYLNYRIQYYLNEKRFSRIESDYPAEMASFFDMLNDLCEEKDYNRTYFIECAASIHFIHKYSNIINKNNVHKRLTELKPERMNFLVQYFNDAWDFLSHQGMIST